MIRSIKCSDSDAHGNGVHLSNGLSPTFSLRMERLMRAFPRLLGLVAVLIWLGAQPAAAQQAQYSSNEILDAGHRFFGGVSRGLAEVVEKAFSQWGLPNGYVLGQEASGVFVVGLRYGEGTLYTKNAGDLRVYW